MGVVVVVVVVVVEEEVVLLVMTAQKKLRQPQRYSSQTWLTRKQSESSVQGKRSAGYQVEVEVVDVEEVGVTKGVVMGVVVGVLMGVVDVVDGVVVGVDVGVVDVSVGASVGVPVGVVDEVGVSTGVSAVDELGVSSGVLVELKEVDEVLVVILHGPALTKPTEKRVRAPVRNFDETMTASETSDQPKQSIERNAPRNKVSS